jgi:hypothetical protein
MKCAPMKRAISVLVVLAITTSFAIAQGNQGSEKGLSRPNDKGAPDTLSDGTKTDVLPHNRATPTPRTVPNDKSVIQRDGKPQK